jgi:hypothetical protein
MRKLIKLARLKREERRLFFSGMALMPVVRMGLFVGSVRRITRFLDAANRRFPRAPGAAVDIRRAAECLEQAARYCPLPLTCLSQALAAKVLMARYGHWGTLCIGVLKSGNKLEAHAWLECQDDVVIGTPVPQGKEYVRMRGAERLTG